MRKDTGEIRRPELGTVEAAYLMNNHLTESALAALIIGEAQAGRLHVREEVREGGNEIGYRVSINQGAYQSENITPAPVLNCLIATTDLALDRPWHMPLPASDEEMMKAEQSPPQRWSHLAMAGEVVENQLREAGYLRPMKNLHSDSINKYGRWAWMVTGAGTYGFLSCAGAPPSAAFVFGTMVAAATAGVQQRAFFRNKATEVESLDAGRFTRKGEAAIAEIQQVYTAMKAIVADDLPLSARTCRDLLPYYPVLRIEGWLGTTACQQAFRRPPNWLKPLNKREPGAIALEKLTQFCLASAWQPGEIHLPARLSASLLRQKATEVTQEAIRDSGPA